MTEGQKYTVAMAAARDAGTRRAREAGRRVWTVGDLKAAIAEFDRLMPETKEVG